MGHLSGLYAAVSMMFEVSGSRFQSVWSFKFSVVSRSCLDFRYIGYLDLCSKYFVKNRNHCNISDGEL